MVHLGAGHAEVCPDSAPNPAAERPNERRYRRSGFRSSSNRLTISISGAEGIAVPWLHLANDSGRLMVESVSGIGVTVTESSLDYIPFAVVLFSLLVLCDTGFPIGCRNDHSFAN